MAEDFKNQNNVPGENQTPPHGTDGHYLFATRIVLVVLAVAVLGLAVYGLYLFFNKPDNGRPPEISTEEKLKILDDLKSTASTDVIPTDEKLDILESLRSGTETSGSDGGDVTGSSNLTDQELRDKLKLLESLQSN